MQLRHRLLALGVGGTVVTALVLFGVGTLQSGRFGDEASTSVSGLSRDNLDHVAQGVTRLAAAIAADIHGVNGSVATAQRAVETSRATASRLNDNATALTALVSRFRL